MSSTITATRRHFHGRLARTLILILLLLSMGPLLLMGSMAYLRARGLLREQIYTIVTAVTIAQGERINSEIRNGQLLLERAIHTSSLAENIETALGARDRTDPGFVLARAAIFNEVSGINQPKPFFNQFLVVTLDGNIHISTYRDWEGQKFGNPSIREQILGKQATMAIAGVEPIDPDSFVVLTAVPYKNSRGEVTATVIGVAESPILRSLILSSVFYSDNNYFVSENGQFIGLNPYPDNFNKLITLQPTETHRRIIVEGINSESRQGVDELNSFDGVPVIAAFTWLPDLKIGWVAEVPQSVVYNQLNTLLIFAILLFIGTVLFMAFILWQGTRRAVQPLLDLAESVQLFADGNWDQRAPVNRNDEIGLLAYSFNQMADDLSNIYQSLESKVEERTSQIRTAAELSQIAISASSQEDLLKQTVNLIVNHFHYNHAAIFLVDETGRYLILQQFAGLKPSESLVSNKMVAINSLTLIGWVADFNQSRVDRVPEGDVPPAWKEHLLPGTRIEAGVPIAIGEQVLGALSIQSTNDFVFSDEEIDELQNLANEIAPAIQNFHLLEATQINLQETNLLYQASHQITQAQTANQIFEAATQALEKTPYATALLLAEGNGLRVASTTSIPLSDKISTLLDWLSIHPSVMEAYFPTTAPIIIEDFDNVPNLPTGLIELASQMECDTVAFLPVMRAEHLVAILMIGAQQKGVVLNATTLQPYTNLVELVVTVLEKVNALENMEKRLSELQTLDSVSQAISVETELQTLYKVIHTEVARLMGDVGFFIALYDAQTDMIEIPYMAEKDRLHRIPPFPLGDGLTSIVIRTRQPLILIEDIESRAQALGAKSTGVPAKSWLGVPLIIAGEAIGAIVVQDIENEYRFGEEEKRLLSTLAAQVAVMVRNMRLLETTRVQAENERTLYEITNKIRRLTSMNSILEATASELGKALGLRSAHIEIRIEDISPEVTPQEAQGNGHNP